MSEPNSLFEGSGAAVGAAQKGWFYDIQFLRFLSLNDFLVPFNFIHLLKLLVTLTLGRLFGFESVTPTVCREDRISICAPQTSLTQFKSWEPSHSRVLDRLLYLNLSSYVWWAKYVCPGECVGPFLLWPTFFFAKSSRGRSTHRFRFTLVCGPNGLASSEFPKSASSIEFSKAGNNHNFMAT